MPINPRSAARIAEFIAELAKNGVKTEHQTRSIYLCNGIKTSIRTTTKSDPKIWYDISEKVIQFVEYFIYQSTSKHHFFIFPSNFFNQQYEKLTASNRLGAKLFYIDPINKRFISQDERGIDVSKYYCSLLPGELRGAWQGIFLRQVASPSSRDAQALPKSPDRPAQLPQLPQEQIHGFEGALLDALSTRHERDPRLRASAISIHGLNCKACGFNFKATYGQHGEYFIEVHHKTALAKLNGSTQIDPESDLIVLCSNCHRMIHHNQNEPLSVEALQNLIKLAKAN